MDVRHRTCCKGEWSTLCGRFSPVVIPDSQYHKLLRSLERILLMSFFIPAGFTMSRGSWSLCDDYVPHLASISCWYRSDARQDEFRSQAYLWLVLVLIKSRWEGACESLYSCHGVFKDRFIFRSNFLEMRLTWDCHDKSPISVTTSLDRNCLSFTKKKVYSRTSIIRTRRDLSKKCG